MLPQLERQFLQANLAQARSLLAQSAPDEDVIEHFQYTQLVNELESKLARMPSVIDHAPAGVALFFGGRPVIGSQGIHADFGSKAIERFQTIVSQRYAAEELGPLASKGRVPMKDVSNLLVTDVVRGSFGFVLQAERDDSSQAADSRLKAVVDKVADTLSRVAAQDESLFDGAAAEIDERQKSALTEFFRLLDNEGATMRVVEGERDFELDRPAVQRARQRVESMRITERPDELTGQIVGWTDHSARFELRRHDTREIVQGSIATDALNRIAAEGIEPYHKHARVSVKARQVAVRNRQTRTTYTLLSLELLAPPAGLDTPLTQQPIL